MPGEECAERSPDSEGMLSPPESIPEFIDQADEAGGGADVGVGVDEGMGGTPAGSWCPMDTGAPRSPGEPRLPVGGVASLVDVVVVSCGEGVVTAEGAAAATKPVSISTAEGGIPEVAARRTPEAVGDAETVENEVGDEGAAAGVAAASSDRSSISCRT